MGATEVPLRVAIGATELLQLAQIAMEKSNPNVASDVLVAKELADAALAGARANVQINLSSITDRDFIARIQDELEGVQG